MQDLATRFARMIEDNKILNYSRRSFEDKRPATFMLFIRDSCGRIKEISANRENFYAELECRNLRSGEDPAIFKWELENLLAKADPSLPADAKKALIARQMRCLTRTLQFKLLEHKPTIQCRTGLRVTKHQQAQRLQPNSQQGIKGRNHSVRFYLWNRYY